MGIDEWRIVLAILGLLSGVGVSLFCDWYERRK